MQFEIIPTKRFEDDLRYYLKKKKFALLIQIQELGSLMGIE